MLGTLSTAAWAAHDVSLATTVGGVLFGRAALAPSLSQISSPEERDRISASAWSRFAWLNLAGHGVMAASWIAGRTLLSGREVSGRARTLTLVKDGLVAASLLTGVASNVLGFMVGKQTAMDRGPAQVEAGYAIDEDGKTRALGKATAAVGTANLVANVALLAVTSMLAMEGNKSGRFAWFSRLLP